MTDESYPDALPAGHRLHWYALERVLGQGGFGITYLATDTNLDLRVAIKEYLPTEIARRRSDASARPRTESHAERYAWGLERFLSEARTLARFDHPNVVRVYSVFEANNTAYMVMRFEAGENLATLLERRGTLPERELSDCLLPILDGLTLVHSAGFIHRDIKPENIYVREDGSPVLLDFGSARKSFGSAKSMTILVAPGYAPLEQYYGDAATQGPWTDIYGLGATCYRAITGQAPLDAVARAKGVLGSAREILPPAVALGRGRYREPFLAAVDHALQLSERDRPQSVAQWRREIIALASPVAAAADAAVLPGRALPLAASPPAPPSAVPSSTRRRALALSAVAGLGALAALAYWSATREAGSITVAAEAPAVRAAAAARPVPMVMPVSMPPTPSASSMALAAAADSTARSPDIVVSAPAASDPPAAPAATAPMTTPTPTAARDPAPREVRAPVHATIGKPTLPALTQVRATTTARANSAGSSAAAPLAMIAVVPVPAPALAPPVAASAPTLPAAPSAAPLAATPTRDAPSPRIARDEQIDAAEAALQRGDHSVATQLLTPWAAAGVPRAQLLLGRTQEARPGGGQSDFEAYVWFSMAARSGEPSAQAMRDKVAAKLQPAEIRQAQQIVEHWRAHAEPVPATTR